MRICTLTPVEMEMAGVCGKNRFDESERQGLRDSFDNPSVDSHIIGASGEESVAKHFGIYWGGEVNVFGKADIGTNIQVRTRTKLWHDLPVKPKDNPNHIYVLVIDQHPKFLIHGWIIGRDARQDRWWHNYGGLGYKWFVPKEELHDIDTLRIVRKKVE